MALGCRNNTVTSQILSSADVLRETARGEILLTTRAPHLNGSCGIHGWGGGNEKGDTEMVVRVRGGKNRL